ncbi:MAG: hypothetical protein ACFFFT_10280 [Candidatus Thorarchaeota archaeon]
MSNFKNNYIQIPDDIEFLLDLCRDLMALLKKCSPNEDIPINCDQLAKLNNIAKRVR